MEGSIMKTIFPRSILAATVAMAGFLSPAPVLANPYGQASAAESASCPQTAAPQPRRARRGLGLGGLLRGIQQSGVGNLLGSGVLGDSQAAQIAGTVAGAALNGESASSQVGAIAGQVIPQIGGDHAVGAAAGAVVGNIAQAASQAQARCAAGQDR